MRYERSKGEGGRNKREREKMGQRGGGERFSKGRKKRVSKVKGRKGEKVGR